VNNVSRVVVSGSRDWQILSPILDRLAKLPKLSTVITGGAEGVDKMAAVAAKTLGHDLIEIHANWKGRGKPAGPFRNARMLDMKPDLLLAFHEDFEKSKGTKDCIRQAKDRGIPVELIHLSSDSCTKE
jgi:hypothetical protein